MHSANQLLALYVDPGSGSMVLQLLLGGAGGVYVAFRLFKERILKALGIRGSENSAAQTTSRKAARE